MTDGVKRQRVRASGAKRAGKTDPMDGRMSTDLAQVVVDKTLAKVHAGTLQPTLQHGLMAQAMLDRRAERAADRQLAIRLAGMLAGSPPPPNVIDVTPLPELLGEGDGAPEFDPDDFDNIG